MGLTALPLPVYRPGHYGASLLVYAPLGGVVLAAGYPVLAYLGGAAMVGLAMLPDYDMKVPFVDHRGPTHTVLFALLVGSALAALAALAAPERGSMATVGLAGFAFAVGTLSVLAHVAADLLTPMGVRPFWPVSGTTYTLSVATADSTVANYVLLALGVFASVLALAGAGAAL